MAPIEPATTEDQTTTEEAPDQEKRRSGHGFYRRMVELLVALHRMDPGSWDHHWRVARQAAAVGESLGLSRDAIRVLWYGGLLHDVGKIRIPREILAKRGPLTPEERALVRCHPELGATILREELEGLEAVAPLVLHHQERFDGHRDGPFPGYPAGLAGEEIPMGARILAVVDAYDAMTSERPYRRSLAPEAARAELCREAGHQFDPRAVEAFLGLGERLVRRSA